MSLQVQKAGWKSRGWMSFTVANNGHLYLGHGSSQTKPTKASSGGLDESNAACFLVNGIPQNVAQTDFADPARNETNGHNIKHAIINIISSGATITPGARILIDGTAPDSTHGTYVTTPDSFQIENGRQELYNFDLINVSGGNMVIEVQVFS